jgi:hypothetical protein
MARFGAHVLPLTLPVRRFDSQVIAWRVFEILFNSQVDFYGFHAGVTKRNLNLLNRPSPVACQKHLISPRHLMRL